MTHYLLFWRREVTADGRVRCVLDSYVEYPSHAAAEYHARILRPAAMVTVSPHHPETWKEFGTGRA